MDVKAKAHKGEVPLEIGDKSYVLSFPYGRQKDFRLEVGKGFNEYLTDATADEDLDALCLLIEYATDGAIARNEVFTISPPIAVVAEALTKLRLLVYYGALEVPEVNPIAATRMGRLLVRMISKYL